MGEPYRTWAKVQPGMFDGLDGSTWINHGSMTTWMDHRSMTTWMNHRSMTAWTFEGFEGSTWKDHGSMTTEGEPRTTEREPMSEGSIMGADDHGSMTEVEGALEVWQSMR